MSAFSRKTWFIVPAMAAAGGLIAGAAGWWPGGSEREEAASPRVTVYKTETCNCCNAWVDHLRNEGFSVTAHNVSQGELNAEKESAGLTYNLASCHTAHVEGYTIEGHVPADDIRRLLEEKPEAAGLTVPGMPVGSPGMEHGNRHDPYDVLMFSPDGNTEIYASYPQ